MSRKRICRVLLTEHAIQRFNWRQGQGKLTAGEVRRRLLAILSMGAKVINGAVEVPLGDGLIAICEPELEGFWLVKTVILAERKREKFAGYG